MKLRIIYTNAGPDGRTAEQRFAPLIGQAGRQGLSIELTAIDDIRSGAMPDVDAVLIHGIADARATLLAEVLRDAGTLVGVDLVADIFGESARGGLYEARAWAADIAPALDFVTCSSPALVDLGARLFPGAQRHLLRDTLADLDPATVGEQTPARARADRLLTIDWSLEGIDPDLATGVEPLAAFGALLGAARWRGYDVTLSIAADTTRLDTQALALLARLPVEWSLADPIAGPQGFIRFLPTARTPFARALAPTLAIEALAAGRQLLVAGMEPPVAFTGLAYTSLDPLIDDLEADRLRVGAGSRAQVQRLLAEQADPAAEARRLAAFLAYLPERAPAPSRRFAILHGAAPVTAVHKFARRMGALSIASEAAVATLSYDVRLDMRGGQASAILSEAAVAGLAGEDRDGLVRLDPEAASSESLMVLPAGGYAGPIALDASPPSRAEAIALQGPATERAARFVRRFLPNLTILHAAATPVSRVLDPEPPAPRPARSSADKRRARQRLLRENIERARPGADEVPAPGPHIAWLLLVASASGASARYRAYHMAMALAPHGVRHSFHTDPRALAKRLDGVDCVVIVKRVDLEVVELAAAAVARGKPVLLDLCDDVLAPSYQRQGTPINMMVFAALAPVLTGVIVPTAAMADRIMAHDELPHVRTFVIPDVAETQGLFQATAEWALATSAHPVAAPAFTQMFAEPLARPNVFSRANPARIVWFGNFGGPHSNFGIASLLAALPALQAVDRDIPLELTVISNSAERYEALIAPLDLATRFVEWGADTIYEELRQADVALLTNGDDGFSQLKSANRALQALALGLPVIVSDNPASRQLGDAVVTGDFEAGLRLYLGPDRIEQAHAAIARARPVLERFDLPRIGARWHRLLRAALARPASGAPREGVLLVAGAHDAVPHFLKTLDDLVATGENVRVTLIAAVAEHPSVCAALIAHGIIPVLLAQEKIEADRRWLRGSMRVLADGSAAAAPFRTLATRAGVPLTLYDDPAATPLAPPPSGALPRFAEAPAADGLNDWLFVTPKESKGWILDAICREIGARHPGAWEVAYNPKQLPRARNYFFAHYWNYLDGRKRNPHITEGNCFVWYTHPREIPYTIEEQLAGYEDAAQILFTCSEFRDRWLELGLSPDKASVVLGGADEALFRGHPRGGGVIGLSSSFYERKNPDLLIALVRLMPHRLFHLIGRKWEEYARWSELSALPNFRYSELAYADYPSAYRGFDVFLSLAMLEGGPIPLLEAMMDNVVPVATRTGFAPDLILHGENGFLFDVGAAPEEIAALIEQAFTLPADIRATVLDFTWDRFAARILGMGETG